MKPADSLGQFEQLVVTAVLALKDNAYGVTIHEKVEQLASPKTVGLGAVYVTLDRLEDKGFLASWLSDPTPSRGGRAKRHYRLEPAGRRALQESATMARRMCVVVAEAWGTRWKPVRQN
jgi:DNA-binding PadR family transcriptional regulator